MSEPIFAVTGAAGHLGGCVVRELLAQDRTVRALLLPGEKCPDYITENRHLLTEYTGDVRDTESLAPLFSDVPADTLIVIHCAGIVTIAKEEDRRVYDVNVGGTENMLKMCRQYKARRMVYVSSVHAIPELPKGEAIREVSRFDPETVMGYYAKTKAEATRKVLEAAADGLDAVVVHPSGIIGPHGLPTGNMTELFTQYLRGKLPAAVRGGYDFVDVRDVARGIVLAALKGSGGECYILSNRFVDLHEMFDILSRAGNRPRMRVYMPLWVAKAATPFTEVYYRLARKTPLFTRYSLETLATNSVFSHDKASRELGYQTRDLTETLTETARWILQHGKNPA